LLAPCPNTQAAESPFFGYPQLLIQYILSYPSHLEDVSSIRKPRERHFMVTGTHRKLRHVSESQHNLVPRFNTSTDNNNAILYWAICKVCSWYRTNTQVTQI